MKKGCIYKEEAGNLDDNCEDNHKMGTVTGELCICESNTCNAVGTSNSKTNEDNDQTGGNGVQGNVPQLAMMIMTFLLGYLAM